MVLSIIFFSGGGPEKLVFNIHITEVVKPNDPRSKNKMFIETKKEEIKDLGDCNTCKVVYREGIEVVIAHVTQAVENCLFDP